jgi:hypothetical protein
MLISLDTNVWIFGLLEPIQKITCMSPGFRKASIVILNVWRSMKTEANTTIKTYVFIDC